MAIKATPEGLDFYEPEDGNKIHFQILDDTGVNAVFGYKLNGTEVIDTSRNLVNIGTINTGQGATEVYNMNQNVRTTDSPTFDNLTVGDSGNTGTSLNIIATNTAGSPAATAMINMSGYEGRAIGTLFTDVSYSGQEWFSGLRYSGGFANYQIGYHSSGGQAEYAAQSLLEINKTGEATFSGGVNSTFLNTGQGDNELYAMNQNVRTSDNVEFNQVTAGNFVGNVSGTADRAEAVDSNDTRGTNDLPNSKERGVYFDFKSNATNGLSDGGSYNGQMHWRSYGGGSDLSGGYPIQISYTASGRLWSRLGTGATTWDSWRQVLDSVSQPYAYNMNQNVRTSDSPQFARVYLDNTNNYIDSNGSYLSFKSGGNEMLFGGSTSMYINYRAALGGTPTHWIWNAGSSSSFAQIYFR